MLLTSRYFNFVKSSSLFERTHNRERFFNSSHDESRHKSIRTFFEYFLVVVFGLLSVGIDVLLVGVSLYFFGGGML